MVGTYFFLPVGQKFIPFFHHWCFVLKIYFPDLTGNQGWTIFGLVLGRFLGIYHPDVENNESIGAGRIALAVLSLIVFLLCFIPKPFG